MCGLLRPTKHSCFHTDQHFFVKSPLCLFLPTQHLAIACHWSQRAAVIGDVVQVYSGSHGRTIVFCETKKDANELSMNASIKQVPETCCSFVDC